MNRHEFAWQNLAFGLLFVAIAANWFAWRQDALTLDQLAVAAPGVLIIVGFAGIIVSLRRNT